MERTRIDYWGPALVVIGVIAIAVSAAVIPDPVRWWAISFSALVGLSGLALVGYVRNR
ncbi:MULTISPECIES: hypothetical protein [unclassified Microbacterium]|uniref:hypothetical protein n=1 Tax=unclassified Microbacterium TaxID=2609290 RepID=UPI003869A52F